MGHQVKQTIRARLPASKVWLVLSDFSSIEKTSISVEKSPLLAGAASGMGTKRKCYFHDGSTVVEEIIDYEEGRRFKIRLSEYSMPLKSLVAEMEVVEVDEETCQISMSMDFVVKGGPVGWLVGLLIIRQVLKRKVLKPELLGLAYHCATGMIVESTLPSVGELSNIVF
jgi:hypothetical protein